ncbi:ComEC family competence protein [Aliigemmobacter aestuarii]|uniref:ComEC family competence protein n=1 Tax=Aliigemmobacter aestuarii TaxID=1445661 RepID=A0A4S3MT65_9RHOB|nr:ComEC/Rec2 family competence protein [Gemmobacter aestuarii]THD85790.1 ComEC family competence protein [Gemmobacter aestuarii]
MRHALLWLPARLAGEGGILLPWAPVILGCGIGLWFALPWEPVLPHYAVAGGVLPAMLAARLWAGDHWHPLAWAMALLATGFLAAGLRAHSVALPVLDFRYYGPVEGRIIGIDRSQSDAIRLTLDRVILQDVAQQRMPARVRVALHGDQALTPEPGQVIALTGHLSPPDGPVEPGSFDFRRMAFFDGLGAVGYTRTPAVLMDRAAPGDQWVNRLRAGIRDAVMARIGGEPGAFAAALLTGDRSGIGRETLDDLRASNLAHLLAISGLHMGLLVAFVFGVVRGGLALIPPLALRLPTKKAAAVVALGAGAFYLLLSGGNVATERAFIMVSVMLVAVLFDRRALSLRSVAMAALLLLLWQPETLMEPGFQMSFAATVALIAGFRALTGRFSPHRLPGWLQPAVALFASSFLAGLATAPVAAVHFNRIADYGLIANLLAVPVMSVLVMPAAVIAGVLAPVGLSQPALWVMEQGTRWILFVAGAVADAPGAVSAVPTPSPVVLPLIMLGGLILCLTAGRVRAFALPPVLAGLVLWSQADRPPLLVSGDGRLVGLLGPEGRALSADRGQGFAASSWLENDGDLATQEEAAARPGLSGPAAARVFVLDGWEGVALRGKAGFAQVADACAAGRLVIVAGRVEDAPPGCALIDEALLRRTGPLAIRPKGDGTLIARPTITQSRLWQRRTLPPDEITIAPGRDIELLEATGTAAFGQRAQGPTAPRAPVTGPDDQ